MSHAYWHGGGRISASGMPRIAQIVTLATRIDPTKTQPAAMVRSSFGTIRRFAGGFSRISVEATGTLSFRRADRLACHPRALCQNAITALDPCFRVQLAPTLASAQDRRPRRKSVTTKIRQKTKAASARPRSVLSRSTEASFLSGVSR